MAIKFQLPFRMENKQSPSIDSMQNVFGATDNSLNWYLSATLAYFIYAVSGSLQNAVNIIADEFSQIRPVLQDKKTKEYVLEHEALSLLEQNDMRFNETQVKKELMVSYCLAGECYPVIEGNVKYEPVGFMHYPANVCSVLQGDDGYISSIIASYQNVITTFNRAIDTPAYKNIRTYLFEDQTKLMQMMHILSNRKRNYLRAQSVLESVYFQALMKYQAGVHNSSIVEKAARPGGMWSPKTVLTQDQYKEFKTGIKESFSGPSNAGRNVITNSPLDYQNLLLTSRDMDFVNLIKGCDIDVYRAYNIPLPMVTTETMTMSNYEKSVYTLYDMAILPKAKFIFKNLGDFILSRYKDGDRFRMVIDEREIPALKGRLLERGQAMRNIYAFSQDEIRNECGHEISGDETGNTVYIPATYTEAGKKDDYDPDRIVIEGQDEPEYNPETGENQDVIDETVGEIDNGVKE